MADTVQLIILAGGYATRLRPLTLTRPKALLPVLDRPLIDWILEEALRSGVDRVVLSLHHMSDKILGHVVPRWGGRVSLDHYVEQSPLGDAGPLVMISESVGIEYPVLVIYGDIFSSVSLRSVYEYHKSRGGITTIVLAQVADPRRFGLAQVDESGKIRGFVEKPSKARKGPHHVNAGIYVFEEEAIKFIERGKKQGIGRDLIPRLIRAGDVYAYIHRGVWNDVGIPEDYIRANMEALMLVSKEGLYIDQQAEVEDGVDIRPPAYIGKGSVVSTGARISGSIVMKGVRVGRSSLVDGSIVLDRTVIEQGSAIMGSIVGEESYIGSWSRISRGSIVGDGVYIGEAACLGEGAIVLPYKELKSEDHCREISKVIL